FCRWGKRWLRTVRRSWFVVLRSNHGTSNHEPNEEPPNTNVQRTGSLMSTKGTHIPDWLQVPFAGITPAPSQQKGQDLFPTGNWRAIRPVYRDKMPPCNNACGTNEKIQGYLDLVKRGKYLDAYALIKEDMPFP